MTPLLISAGMRGSSCFRMSFYASVEDRKRGRPPDRILDGEGKKIKWTEGAE